MNRSRIVMSLVGLVAILLVNFAAIFKDFGPKVSHACECIYPTESCKDPVLGRDYCGTTQHSWCDRCNCGYN